MEKIETEKKKKSCMRLIHNATWKLGISFMVSVYSHNIKENYVLSETSIVSSSRPVASLSPIKKKRGKKERKSCSIYTS